MLICSSSIILSSRLCSACFFFKQKTAYEMRISDWSSDVCSSDLEILACSSRLGWMPQPATRHRRYRTAAADRSPLRGGGRPGEWPPRQEIGRASCRERVCQYV